MGRAAATADVVKDAKEDSPNRLLYTSEFSGTLPPTSTSSTLAPTSSTLPPTSTSSTLPPTSSTSSTVPPAEHMWKVESGACTMDAAGCIQSPHYPSKYENNERCIITVTESIAVPIVVE